MKTARLALLIGAIFFVTAIGLGAFGAHTFKDVLSHNQMETVFKTASQYHFYQALGIMVLACVWQLNGGLKWQKRILFTQVVGGILFSASLYLLATLNLAALGAITPIGGVLMIIGWLAFALSLIIKDDKD